VKSKASIDVDHTRTISLCSYFTTDREYHPCLNARTGACSVLD